MPKHDDYVVGLASRDDIPALLELQRKNLLGAGGALSVELSFEWFERSMEEMPVVVAKRDDILVGYLVSSSRTATRHVALSEAKYHAYPASSDAYNSGPLCIAASERGRGLAAQLFHAMRTQLPGREAVTFIRHDNASSRALHRKLAFREVAAFRYGNVDYVVAAHVE